MRPLIYSLLAILFALSCKKKEEEPYFVDYEIQYVNNVSIVPLQVRLVNKCTGAKNFIWRLGMANKDDQIISTDRNPPVFSIDTIGCMYISLDASNMEENQSYIFSKKFFVYRNNDIVSFRNIKLGGIDYRDSLGCYFATSNGKIYKAKELSYIGNNGANYSTKEGSYVDFAYIGLDGMRFFESPDKVKSWGLLEIHTATATKIINYIETSNIKFDVNMFDNMKNDSLLLPLNIVPDGNSFGTDVPRIVLFENASKRRGVIKINEIVPGTKGYIRFDLKIQRYPMILPF